MTSEARLRRIGWIAVLAVCAALYLGLHLKVHSIQSEVVRAERRIVQLEQQTVLLETEFLSRSNQLQLAQWNRVDFGYSAPEASQFITGERQLAMLGDAPVPSRISPSDDGSVQLASYSPAEPAVVDEVPELVSPLTGRPVDPALLAVAERAPRSAPRLAMVMPQGQTRIQLTALAEATIR